MRKKSIRIDMRRRSLSIGGSSTVLQEKAWQVLVILLERAPEVVARAHIIDSVWQGNYLTGEKGLNQSLWTIRAALGDNARDPEFLRTVPRVGYQWIYPHVTSGAEIETKSRRTKFANAAGIAGLLVMTTTAAYLTRDAVGPGAESSPESTGIVATKAYLVDRDIFVDMSNGCRAILKNSGNKEVGAPVLSSDGAEVAFTLRENAACRLVTIELPSGKRSDFADCPSDVI